MSAPSPLPHNLVLCRLRPPPRPVMGIGVTLPFERVHVVLAGRPDELCGTVTVVGNRVTWRIVEVAVSDVGGRGSWRFRSDTDVFETLAAALYQQCGDDIRDRLNALVEEQGLYAVLHGEAMPADPWRRGAGRQPEPDKVIWLDAA